jgi:hypothetical protein
MVIVFFFTLRFCSYFLKTKIHLSITSGLKWNEDIGGEISSF